MKDTVNKNLQKSLMFDDKLLVKDQGNKLIFF